MRSAGTLRRVGNSTAGKVSTSGRPKAREALWLAICFNMSVADWRGVSQILFMLIACPQSLHIIRVRPAIFLLVLYITLSYASLEKWYRAGTANLAFGHHDILSQVRIRGRVLLEYVPLSGRSPLSNVDDLLPGKSKLRIDCYRLTCGGRGAGSFAERFRQSSPAGRPWRPPNLDPDAS
jgi:hypothetical protein